MALGSKAFQTRLQNARHYQLWRDWNRYVQGDRAPRYEPPAETEADPESSIVEWDTFRAGQYQPRLERKDLDENLNPRLDAFLPRVSALRRRHKKTRDKEI